MHRPVRAQLAYDVCFVMYIMSRVLVIGAVGRSPAATFGSDRQVVEITDGTAEAAASILRVHEDEVLKRALRTFQSRRPNQPIRLKLGGRDDR